MSHCLIIISFKQKEMSTMYCIRDRKGVRPLFLGKKNNNYVVMSENCAIDKNEFIRDILPGEILKINNDGYKTIYNYKIKNTAFCIFEHIYFLNPKSVVDGYSVIKQRQKLGLYLSKKKRLVLDKHLKSRTLKFKYLKVYDGPVPEDLEQARQHYKNYFELPVLFYVLLIFIYET